MMMMIEINDVEECSDVKEEERERVIEVSRAFRRRWMMKMAVMMAMESYVASEHRVKLEVCVQIYRVAA